MELVSGWVTNMPNVEINEKDTYVDGLALRQRPKSDGLQVSLSEALDKVTSRSTARPSIASGET